MTKDNQGVEPRADAGGALADRIDTARNKDCFDEPFFPEMTLAERDLIVAALRTPALPAAGEVLSDDKLAGWARNWHWQDCAKDKPVDPSIYFRDMRMLKAFVAKFALALPQSKEAGKGYMSQEQIDADKGVIRNTSELNEQEMLDAIERMSTWPASPVPQGEEARLRKELDDCYRAAKVPTTVSRPLSSFIADMAKQLEELRSPSFAAATVGEALEPFVSKMQWPMQSLPDTDVVQCRVVTPDYETSGTPRAFFGLTVGDFRRLAALAASPLAREG